MTSYREDQYTAVVRVLQPLFSTKNHNRDDYIVKVLMPEALIKICMRVYQCSKESAETFLLRDNKRTNFVNYPKGSATHSPALLQQQPQKQSQLTQQPKPPLVTVTKPQVKKPLFEDSDDDVIELD
jgi:hypothetical protein